jgi:hypothetical protein
MLVGGRANGSGVGRYHGREGGVVFGEQCVVAVERVSSRRCHVPGVGGGEVMPRGNPCPFLGRSAKHADVVSFLKVSMWCSWSSFVLWVKT